MATLRNYVPAPWPASLASVSAWSVAPSGSTFSSTSASPGPSGVSAAWAVSWAATSTVGGATFLTTIKGLTPGSSYTLTMLVNGTSSVGVYPQAYFVTSGPSATLTPGAWVPLTVTFTATSTSHQVGLGNATALSSTTQLYVSAVMVVDAVYAGTSYFDGSFATAYWSGTPGCSVSISYTAAGTFVSNPNLPRLDVALSPVSTPTIPGSSSTPANSASIYQRITQVSTSRGRQYELDTDQTGTASWTADNSDGLLTSSDLSLGSNVVISATWQGVTYRMWTGFLDSIETDEQDARHAYVNQTAVDGLDMLANRALRTVMSEAILASSTPPALYYPLSEQEGSASAADASGNAGPAAKVVNWKYGGGQTQFGTTSFVVGDGGSGWQDVTETSGVGSQLQISGFQNYTGMVVDTSQYWTVAMCLQATAGASVFFSMLDMTGSPLLQLTFDVSAQTVTFSMPFATQSVWIPAANLAAGVLITAGVDSTGAFLSWDGYVRTKMRPTWFGIANHVAIGQCFLSTLQLPSVGAFSVQHVALWFGGQVPTDDDRMTWWGAFQGFPGDTAPTRIGRILSWCGWGPLYQWNDNAETTPLGPQADTANQSALSAIQAIQTSVLGRFLVNEQGVPLFESRQHNLTATPSVVLGSNTAAGEIPYTGMPQRTLDKAHVYNDVSVQQDSGTVARIINATSVRQYGQRVLQANSSVQSSFDAMQLASDISMRYGQPAWRVSTVTIEPSANPSLFPQVLAIQVGSLVQLNHRTQLGTVAMACTVESVHHETTADAWTTTLELSVLPSAWILEDSVSGVLESTTSPTW